jgi:hypothetical protein
MPTPETALKLQLRCKTGNPKSPTLCIRDEWPTPSSLSELFQCRVCVLEFIWSELAAAIFRIEPRHAKSLWKCWWEKQFFWCSFPKAWWMTMDKAYKKPAAYISSSWDLKLQPNGDDDKLGHGRQLTNCAFTVSYFCFSMASLQEKGVSGVEKDVLASGRNACYKARDAFFRCVEADAGHTTPTEVASVGLLYPSQCKTLRANYEQLCRSTWVFPQSCLEFGFALPNHYTHWSTNLFIVFFGNCLSCDGMRWLRHWYLQICVDSLLKRRYHSQAYHWGDGSILQWFCSIWVNGWYGAGEAFWPSVLCKEKDQAVIGYRYWSATYFITTEDNHWASTRW